MADNIESRVFKLESRAALENLVGTYLHLRLAGKGPELVEQLWVDSPDACIEIGASGKYESGERVATFYQKDLIPGKFLLLHAVAPVIEIADDLKSARGLWFSYGIETDSGELNPAYVTGADPERDALLSSEADGKRYTAEWLFEKLAFDFVMTDAGWRILHLHAYEITRCPFDRDWVRYATERFDTDGQRLDAYFKSNLPFAEDKPPENNATSPSSYHWQYMVDTATEFVPAPPVPYQTLSELPEL